MPRNRSRSGGRGRHAAATSNSTETGTAVRLIASSSSRPSRQAKTAFHNTVRWDARCTHNERFPPIAMVLERTCRVTRSDALQDASTPADVQRGPVRTLPSGRRVGRAPDGPPGRPLRTLPSGRRVGRAPDGPPGRPRDPIRKRRGDAMRVNGPRSEPHHTGIVRRPGQCPSRICPPSTLRLTGREPPSRRARGVRVRRAFRPRSSPGADIAPRVRWTRGAAGTERTRPSRPHPRRKSVASMSNSSSRT
jgi:hypothetical protein